MAFEVEPHWLVAASMVLAIMLIVLAGHSQPKRENRTSLDYTRPYRPRVVWLVNHIAACAWAIFPPLRKIPSLDPDSLLRVARSRAGRRVEQAQISWGGAGPEGKERERLLRIALERLVAAAEAEAKLTFMGRIILRERLLGLLCNRLRVEFHIRASPEVLDEDLDVVFVTGLARSGTTFLHRLLAADSDTFQHLPSWEALNVAPDPTVLDELGMATPQAREQEQATRKKKATASARAFRWLAPDFFAIHPIEMEAPEEEVLVMDLTLLSMVAESTMNVPSYSRWLESTDQTPSYEYLARVLKLLQWNRRKTAEAAGLREGTAIRKKTWILKTPDHLQYLEELTGVFPAARILVTHRKPAECLASFCSMVAHGHGLHSDSVPTAAIGRHWLAKQARCLVRAEAFRSHFDETRLLDIQYKLAVRDPMQLARKIYSFLDLPLSEKTEHRLVDFLQNNRQHKYGRHQYSLESFHLDVLQVADAFRGYS